MRAGATVRRVLVAESLLRVAPPRIGSLLDALRIAGAELFAAPDAEVDRLMEGRGAGALVGLVALPPDATLDDVLRDREGARDHLLVTVDVLDPGNVGALVRTALASGARAVVSVGPADPYHPKAVRTSMGGVFRLPVVRFGSLEAALAGLRGAGFETVGAVARGGTPLPEVRWDARRIALVAGGEAFGLGEDALGELDRRVTIPMGAEIDSYSVNAAAAILLHAIATAARGAAGETLRGPGP